MQIRSWMASCEQEHPQCRKTQPLRPRLPHRVIDVGQPGEDASISLYESKEQEQHDYLALSHCWGDPRTVPKTTLETLALHRHQIPEATLSQTFKDAVEITKTLGFRYIWIDALCIVQDDPDDWAKEAALMQRVYAGASLTIAATSSKDGTGGCHNERQSGHEFELTCPNNACTGLRVRPAVDHDFPTLLTGGHHHTEGSSLPLQSKKWAFQERMLSRRLFHYTNDELIWECGTETWCECGSPLDQTFRHKSRFVEFQRTVPTLPNKEAQKLALDAWCSQVGDYSCMHLAHAIDILPAFSAFVRTSHGHGLGSYKAGLWDASLPALLCWRSYGGNRRPPSYCAPTWSWASVQGHVDTRVWQIRDDRPSSAVRDAVVLSVQCTPEGPDPFGRITGGMLVLQAAGFETRVLRCDSPATTRVLRRDSPAITFGDWNDRDLECYFDTDDERVGIEGQLVWVTYVYQHGYWFESLVLRQNLDGTFRRIGLLRASNGNPATSKKLRSFSRKTFNIV